MNKNKKTKRHITICIVGVFSMAITAYLLMDMLGKSSPQNPNISNRPSITMPSDNPTQPTGVPAPTQPPHICSFTYDHTVQPTCTTPGKIISICSCGQQNIETTPQLDHIYEVDHTIDPTCTTVGKTIYSCTCGDQKVETIPMVDHSFEYSHTSEATCTDEGKVVYTCSCGIEKTDTIPKVNHTYVYSRTIEPTCSAEGKEIFTCICGQEKVNIIEKIDHKYSLSMIIDATCTTTGKRVYTCICGAEQADIIPVSDHIFTYSHTIEATCTDEGKVVYTCSCGTEKADTLPKVNHTYVYSRTIEPTCSAEGKEIFTCICGQEKINIIEKIDHKYSLSMIIDATCTTTGQRIYTCICGAERTDIIPMNDHIFTYSHTIEATCTTRGQIVYSCVCGKEKSTVTDMLAHIYVIISTKEPTKTSEGYRIFSCYVCSHSYSETIPQIPPAYETEHCCLSLLGKALPHTHYFQYMVPIMERYAAKMTMEQSQAAGLLAMPAFSLRDDFIAEFRTVYRYMYYTLPYSIISNGSTAPQFLAWSPENSYNLLQDCYNEVYRILDELCIDENTSKYDAIYRINDYLCETRFYQTASNQDLSAYKNNSTYFSIFSSGANCHNYSLAFQMLCLGAGIECHYYPSKTMNHAWNLVYFDDGSSYWVDVCWNDAQYQFSDGTIVETSVANGVPIATVKRLRETYLLITTDQLLADHTL